MLFKFVLNKHSLTNMFLTVLTVLYSGMIIRWGTGRLSMLLVHDVVAEALKQRGRHDSRGYSREIWIGVCREGS